MLNYPLIFWPGIINANAKLSFLIVRKGRDYSYYNSQIVKIEEGSKFATTISKFCLNNTYKNFFLTT